jgi:glycosyltransferase involved in cell wall biosynthesis
MIPEIFGYDFNSPMWAQKRRCFINGKYFVGISQTTRKDFKRYYPSKPRSYLNFCGLDTERFEKEDFSIIKKLQINKPFFILIATNTDTYKNAATLIKLFISHPNLLDDFDFICLSDKFIQNPGIKWASRLSNTELTSLYRNCEGLIQPSLYEGFGYPVIEAMYHKKNVLAYKSPATHEIGIDHCIYFNSVDDLRNKIYEIHKDKHKDKIEGGYSRAISFSAERQSETFNQIINDIV